MFVIILDLNRIFPEWLKALVAFSMIAASTAPAHAERTYLYREADGTVWFTNINPRAQDSAKFTLLEIRGRAPAVVSCRTAERVARARLFEPQIKAHAQKNGIDANLIRAVIRTESCFDNWAISSAGAQGLMQLMPTTARELGADNPFEASQNIDAGTRYLARMLRRFNDDLSLALAAYNAGPGAVAKHKGIPPYAETQTYVEKVMSHYRQYASGDD